MTIRLSTSGDEAPVGAEEQPDTGHDSGEFFDAVSTDSDNDDLLSTDSDNDDLLSTDSDNDDLLSTDSDNDELLSTDSDNDDLLSTDSDNDDLLSTDSDNDDLLEDLRSDEEHEDLSASVRNWATKYSCTRTALNDLLDILQRNGHRLPKDARTLLKTPRSVQSIDKCGGHYIYFSLTSGILRYIVLNHHVNQNSKNGGGGT